MPLKTCPKCKEGCGPRLQVCKCGHVFGSKTRRERQKGKSHPLVPEPGGWVLDTYHDLPEISCPGPLPDGPVDADAIREHIQYEGLGFCVYHLIPPARVKDPALRKLWKSAREAMQRVTMYLYDIPFDKS